METKLEINAIYLGWSKGYDHYTKGHIDKQLFIDTMNSYHRNESFDIEKVRHEYWRYVPDSSGDYAMLVYKQRKASRGAFPVTVIQWDY